MKRLLLVLLAAAPLFGQTVTGRFAAGETYLEPERNAPPATSRMFVRNSDGQGVDLPATGQGGMIIVVNDRNNAAPQLRTPGGDSSSSSVQRFSVDSAGHDVLHIERTIAGRYRMSGISKGTTVIASEPDSSVTMTTTVGPLSRSAGEAVTLEAQLRDGEQAIEGGNVIAHLIAPDGSEQESIVLKPAGNGSYAATVKDIDATPGFWSVRYDASGVSMSGAEFARTSSNQFMNERASARLGIVRMRRDGDTLRVTANANVLEAGNYRLDVIVASSRDEKGERAGIAWGESQQTLTPGLNRLSIELPGVTTDDVFVDVRLLALDSMGVAGRVTLGE